MRSRAVSAVLAAGLCLTVAAEAFARGGDPDLTFGQGGTAALRDPYRAGFGQILQPLAEGVTVSFGSGYQRGVEVERTLANGQPDPSFGDNGVTTLPWLIDSRAMAIQPDGSIIIAGPKVVLFSVGPAVTSWGFARLRPDGSIDTSFGDSGWSFVSNVDGFSGLCSLRVLPDGRIALVMVMTDTDGINVGHIAALRLLANGKPDPAYGVSGIVDHAFGNIRASPTLNAMRVLDDGTVEVGHGLEAGRSLTVSRLAPDGTLDVAFGSDGTNTPLPFSLGIAATVMSYLPDGSIVVATVGLDPQAPPLVPHYLLTVARIRPGGGLQFPFGLQGVARASVSMPEITAILAAPDGGIVIAGTMQAAGLELVKLDGQGRLVTRFGQQGIADVAVAIQSFRSFRAVMDADGFVTAVGLSDGGGGGPGTWLVRLQAMPDVVEFHNDILDHYFMTYDGAEATGIDSGAAGPGWSRTSAGFKPGGASAVCRFYGTPGIGPNSHFYTADPGECEAVKTDRGWSYEGTGFYTSQAVGGACTAPLMPVHRLYNDGFAHGVDSNHRYVVDTSLIAPMVARGWIHEGIAFCAKP